MQISEFQNTYFASFLENKMCKFNHILPASYNDSRGFKNFA